MRTAPPDESPVEAGVADDERLVLVFRWYAAERRTRPVIDQKSPSADAIG